MDLGKNLQDSFNLYFKNFGILFLATFVTALLSSVTFGILAGPLAAGLLVLTLQLIQGEPGEFKEIFAHFDQFGPVFLLSLLFAAAMVVLFIVGLIPLIGWLVMLAIGPALSLLYFLAAGQIVIEKKPVIEAIQQAINHCTKTKEPLLIWVFVFVSSLLAGIGGILFGFGAILTMPFGTAAMGIAYQQLTTAEPAVNEG